MTSYIRQRYFPLNQTERNAARFQRYADSGALKQGLWKNDSSACALGAYFNADTSRVAYKKCIEQHLPQWLIACTPTIFDSGFGTPGYHITWAQALFGVDGLLSKISRLPKAQQVRVWASARTKIRCYMNTYPVKAVNPVFLDSHNVASWVVRNKYPEEAAGSIVVAIEDAYNEVTKVK